MLTILLTGMLQGSSTCWEDESIGLVCFLKEQMIWDSRPRYAAIWVKGFSECRQLCGNERSFRQWHRSSCLQSFTMQQILISFHKRYLFQVFRPNRFCMFVTRSKLLNASYHKFWNKLWKLFSVTMRCVSFDLSPLGLLILPNHDMYDLRAIYYCHWILPFARGWLPLMSSETVKVFLQSFITDFFLLDTVTIASWIVIFETCIFCKAALKCFALWIE